MPKALFDRWGDILFFNDQFHCMLVIQPKRYRLRRYRRGKFPFLSIPLALPDLFTHDDIPVNVIEPDEHIFMDQVAARHNEKTVTGYGIRKDSHPAGSGFRQHLLSPDCACCCCFGGRKVIEYSYQLHC